MYTRRSTSLLPLILVSLAVLIAAVVFLALSPRIAGISPAQNAAGVSSLAPIVVAFNQPMDAASVQSHFQINPATEGVFTGDSTTLRFTPRAGWDKGTTVEISITAGARSARGLPLLTDQTWRFTVGVPRIAYLAETNGIADVWAIPLGSGTAEQITHEQRGVLDFAPSPDGTRLVYSAPREGGGSDLWLVNADGTGAAELLACPDETCRAPQWSPDGGSIAFERRHSPTSESSGGLDADRPHVWLIELATGATMPMPPESDVTASPRWSPDGQFLAVYDATAQAIVVNRSDGERATSFADASGEMGVWLPDSSGIIVPSIVIGAHPLATAPPGLPTPTLIVESVGNPDAPAFYSHLVRVDIPGGASRELTTDEWVEDATPSLAPGGEWIAFGRKYLDAARWTPGRQLWIARADGTQARALTQAGDYQHSAFVWSPDGGRIVYTRFNVADIGTPPEIWIINADGTGAAKLVEGGYLPAWLP